MSAAALLARLDGVKPTGPGRWIAKCPAHQDRHPSLSIRELEDGRILVHDFAGCSLQEVLGAVGLEMDALFPERETKFNKAERAPFNAYDVLRCLSSEVIVVVATAAAILNGTGLTPADRQRLTLAASRVNMALQYAGVRHA